MKTCPRYWSRSLSNASRDGRRPDATGGGHSNRRWCPQVWSWKSKVKAWPGWFPLSALFLGALTGRLRRSCREGGGVSLRVSSHPSPARGPQCCRIIRTTGQLAGRSGPRLTHREPWEAVAQGQGQGLENSKRKHCKSGFEETSLAGFSLKAGQGPDGAGGRGTAPVRY